jgi:hypothetical protein
MSETPSTLQTILSDQRDLLIDYWVDRLFDHPDSNFERNDFPELDRICGEGLDACLALLEGREEPNLKQFVRKLAEKRSEWNLEGADLLRFFWELRNAVDEVSSRGENPGRPNWRLLHDELDTCIETGVFNLMEFIENERK